MKWVRRSLNNFTMLLPATYHTLHLHYILNFAILIHMADIQFYRILTIVSNGITFGSCYLLGSDTASHFTLPLLRCRINFCSMLLSFQLCQCTAAYCIFSSPGIASYHYCFLSACQVFCSSWYLAVYCHNFDLFIGLPRLPDRISFLYSSYLDVGLASLSRHFPVVDLLSRLSVVPDCV